jgi:polyisoprenoid-binding protein YceI
MNKFSFAAWVLATTLSAGGLTFESGAIKAHTEVFGDSSIDPMFKKATSKLTMEESVTSLRGSVEVSITDFISDNAKRDTNMRESMESDRFPKASFEIKEIVVKGGDSMSLKGSLTLHGVTKPLSFEGSVKSEGDKVHIKAKSALKMSEYGITPPKMVFLTVRDQVELSVDMVLKR